MQLQYNPLRVAAAAPAEDAPQPPASAATSAATSAALTPSISTQAVYGRWSRCALLLVMYRLLRRASMPLQFE
jgi:hypothetical protein